MAFQRDPQNVFEESKLLHIPSTPFPDWLDADDVISEDEQLRYFDEVPRLKLPSKGIEEWSTLVNIEALHNLTSHSVSCQHDPVVDRITTWIIPAIQGVKKEPKPETNRAEAQGHTSLVRGLTKNLSIYAIASFMVPLSGLILVPFLTRSLSSEIYGAFAILTTAIALVAGITQLGLGSAFLRAYNYDYKTEDERASVLSNMISLLSLVSMLTTTIILSTASWLSGILFNTPSLANTIRIAGILILIQNIALPGLLWLRAENRTYFYTAVSTLNLFVNLGATLFLVGFLHMGIYGALIATGCSYLSNLICVLPTILLRIKFKFFLKIEVVKNLLSFGLPLVPSFVSIWILQLSDRYLLGRLGSLTETASYSVAYTLGGILGVVVIAPFMLAWPTAMYTIAKKDEAPHIFQLVFRWYSLFLLFVTNGLLLVTRIGFSILFPPSYHSASPVMPVVAISIVFYGVYNIFTIGASIKRKSFLILLFTSSSALLNIVLNLILIPRYGAMGAAFATLLAYGFLACIAYVANQRIYPVPFEIGSFGIALLLGIIIYISCTLLTPSQDVYRTSIVYLIGLIVYSGSLVGLGKFSAWRVSKQAKYR